MNEKHKALLVGVNSNGEFLIQDRAGHKLPKFGFFGGGVEKGETAIEAAIRETKEELDVDITEHDVSYLGTISGKWGDTVIVRDLFLYRTEQKEFTVLEGAGAMWLNRDEMRSCLDPHEQLDRLFNLIDSAGCMHKVEQLQINSKFVTTVEITGPKDARECIIFSHGFGVCRDSRGMFTDLVHVLSKKYLCVQFEYTREDGGDTWVDGYEHMPQTLEHVLGYVRDRYQLDSMNIIGHSMGCILAAGASVVFDKTILLAPAVEPMADRLLHYFKQNPHTVVGHDGVVSAARSDGSVTHIRADFFDHLSSVVPKDYFAAMRGNVVVIEAADDEVVVNDHAFWNALANVDVVVIPGDHNFKAPHRTKLIQVVVDCFSNE